VGNCRPASDGRAVAQRRDVAIFVQGAFRASRSAAASRWPARTPTSHRRLPRHRFIHQSRHLGPPGIRLRRATAAGALLSERERRGASNSRMRRRPPESHESSRAGRAFWTKPASFNYRLSSRDVKACLTAPSSRRRRRRGRPMVSCLRNVVRRAPASSRSDVEDLLRRNPDATNVIETSRPASLRQVRRPVGPDSRFLFRPRRAITRSSCRAAGERRCTCSAAAAAGHLSEIVVSQGDQAATVAAHRLNTGKPCYFEILHFYKGDAGGSLRLGWRLPDPPSVWRPFRPPISVLIAAWPMFPDQESIMNHPGRRLFRRTGLRSLTQALTTCRIPMF